MLVVEAAILAGGVSGKSGADILLVLAGDSGGGGENDNGVGSSNFFVEIGTGTGPLDVVAEGFTVIFDAVLGTFSKPIGCGVPGGIPAFRPRTLELLLFVKLILSPG